MKERLELIRKIIQLHNIFCIESTKLDMWDMTSSLWDENKIDLKADRYYIVESLSTNNDDYDNKTFKPKVGVRYHLRSKEANAYGPGHNAYHRRYLETIEFSYEDLADLEKYRAELIQEFTKRNIKENA